MITIVLECLSLMLRGFFRVGEIDVERLCKDSRSTAEYFIFPPIFLLAVEIITWEDPPIYPNSGISSSGAYYRDLILEIKVTP